MSEDRRSPTSLQVHFDPKTWKGCGAQHDHRHGGSCANAVKYSSKSPPDSIATPAGFFGFSFHSSTLSKCSHRNLPPAVLWHACAPATYGTLLHSGNVRHSIAFRICTAVYIIPAKCGSLLHSGNVRQSIAFRQRTAVYCIPATCGNLLHSGNVRQSTALRHACVAATSAATPVLRQTIALRQRTAVYCTAATYDSLLHCGKPVLRQRTTIYCTSACLCCGNVRQSIALRQRTTVKCTAATYDSLLHCGNVRQSIALRNAHFCNSDILHTCRMTATADQIILMPYAHSNITDNSKAVCPQ